MVTIKSEPVHITVHLDDTKYPTKVHATVDEIFTGNVLMTTEWVATGSDVISAAQSVFNTAFEWIETHMDDKT